MLPESSDKGAYVNEGGRIENGLSVYHCRKVPMETCVLALPVVPSVSPVWCGL